MEIWKQVKDYENYYISNLGNLKRIYKSGKVKYLKYNISDGYYKITLCKNNIKKNKMIHRLVAETFIDNPNNYNCVNHKDENKLNNNVDNLEWCTIKYNSNYGERNKKVSEANKRPVLQIKNNKVIKLWPSIKEASEELKISRGNISLVIYGKRKSAGGYQWK